MRVLPFLVLLVGCKHPPDAPEELDQLVGYLYEHVADEDPAPLEVGTDNMKAWLDQGLEQTLEGYTVNNLSQEAVDALDDGTRDLDGLVGAAVGHDSTFSVDELGRTIILTPPTTIYPDTYTKYDRDFHGDSDCFAVGDCDFLEMETHSTSNYALGLTVDINSLVQFRWVDTDLGRVLIQRSWMHTPATVSLDILDVKQQFYLWMFLPTETGSLSVQATWMVATISDGSVPEDLALNLVIDSMSNTAQTLDDFVTDHP